MQKQDEEALKAALYQEIGQIKAELAQQKKINFPLVLLSTISTGIIVPIIVWAIENFLANPKLPIAIQTFNGWGSIYLVYLVISTVCAYLFIWWLIHHITHPFRCECGYSSWFAGKFKHHFNTHADQKKKAK